MRSMSASEFLISRYTKPRKFSGAYNCVRKADTSTTSPTVMRPASTPCADMNSKAVTPALMMAAWPMLSMFSDTWLRTAASTHCPMFWS